ncbi:MULTISPECIES: class I SAM-dependent methyltransferase [unclassified Nocardiopsis]|uniref:class I SAM-dependent methyltransferase n=1 Tax=Nocardiopsis TaxID=2013 RepID=UPI00387AC6EF
MTAIANTEQKRAWEGEVGAPWVAGPDRYDAMLQEFNPLILAGAGIAPDSRVLDVGCGTGRLTREAGALAERGSALGVDISATMLRAARERTPAGANVSYEHADAQVHPFPEAGFDVVVSRGGVMFFDDAGAAFANIARAVRPGGRMSLLLPAPTGPEDDHTLATAALHPYMTAGPTPTRRRMMSLLDPDLVRGLLEGAGFADVANELVHAPSHLGSDPADAAAFLTGQAGIRPHLEALDPAERERALAALTADLAAFHGPEGVRVMDPGRVVTAVRR